MGFLTDLKVYNCDCSICINKRIREFISQCVFFVYSLVWLKTIFLQVILFFHRVPHSRMLAEMKLPIEYNLSMPFAGGLVVHTHIK